ncbi:heterokaryon incompatibility protein-domain-containing protein [Rhexocercosporidium sp. MPI-PUGE-AT-0058]|nr:heterokaryon incompatibility protein-domain-containing protein [Rhexocercosporidium sp. MPI-PUGE-AT-0058]
MAPRWLSKVFWQKTGSLRLTSDKLCSTCSNLNFSALFETSHQEPGKWTARIPLKCVLKNSKCPFCRLVLQTILASTGGYARRASLDLFSDDQDQVCLEREGDEYWHDERMGVRFYVPRLAIRDCGNNKIYIHALRTSGADSGAFLSANFLRGRRIDALLDGQLVKSWVQDCERVHGASCRSGAWNLENASHRFCLRLIDVEDKCVVTDKSFTYAALSYVRGEPESTQLLLDKSTSKRLFEKGGVSDQHSDIPSTIEDAMDLCKLIGYRYLWVHALCIVQDDTNEGATHATNIHRIYERAALTIVCARGADSWAGLPGICQRDTQQHVETVQGLRMSNALCEFDSAIASSVWNTRASTLQEKLFSKRLLYFTDDQVFFECGQAQWQEDRVFEVDPDVRISRKISKCSQAEPRKHCKPSLCVPNDWPFGDNFHLTMFHDLLDIFVKRKLDEPGEILRLFSGISSKFSEIWDCEFFWGLPIKFFDNELMFQNIPGGIRRRRDGFPSWSWAGWQNPDRCSNERHMVYHEWNWNFFNANSWFRILNDRYVRLGNTGVHAQEEVFEDAGAGRTLEVFLSKPRDNIEQSLLPLLPLTLTGPEKERLLVIQTHTGFLDMACPDDSSYHDLRCRGCVAFGPDRLAKPVTAIHSIILGRDLRRGQMEFMLLGHVSYVDGAESGDEEVILMAIKTDGRGISQRVDMPRKPVLKSRWDACKPLVRPVFLM